MLKHCFLWPFFMVSLFGCHAQQQPQPDAAVTTLKNIQSLPAFMITAVPDSSIFKSEQLQKDRPVVIMLFSPDCDHCQKQTKEFLAYKQELVDIQIVMVSSLSYALIKEFYTDYQLSSMPNIILGQDINYALRVKFRPTNYPGIYVYDAKHNLAKVYAGNIGVPTIIASIK